MNRRPPSFKRTATLFPDTTLFRSDVEGCHAVRPDDAVLVMARLDDAADQARYADTVGAHLDRHLLAVAGRHHGAHGLLILGSEKERSEEHTSELQSLMRNSYAVFCLKKKNKHTIHKHQQSTH